MGSARDISIIGDETIGEKSLFEENKIIFKSLIKPEAYKHKPSATELKAKQLTQKFKSEKNQFNERNDMLLEWSQSIHENYGYRVRSNMTQCAGDTREGILSESLIDVRNESIHDAINDPMSLLRCDIRLKIKIPRLSQEQIDLIARKLSMRTADHTIVAEFERNQCTKGDLSTLNGLQWLNDEVINYYLQLIRSRSDNSSYLPAVHCFNTFLYPQLKSKGHSAVKRWTKKINLFDFQMIFFPIHLGMHWCLAYADMRHQVIYYLDALGGNNQVCQDVLLEYLREEHLVKSGTPLNSKWRTESISKLIPQQQNSSDCGMFTLKFADYISRDLSIGFSQDNMPNFRKIMKYEILSNTLIC